MVSLKKELILNVCSYQCVNVCSFEVKQNKFNLSVKVLTIFSIVLVSIAQTTVASDCIQGKLLNTHHLIFVCKNDDDILLGLGIQLCQHSLSTFVSIPSHPSHRYKRMT